MKKIKILLLVLALFLFLVGCSQGNSNDKLSKEEVIEKVTKEFENLNSINQKSNMEIVFDLKDRKDTQKIDIEVEMIYDKEKNVESIYTSNKTMQNNTIEELNFYKDSEKAYINEGNGWVEYNSGESYSTTYKPILDSFLEVANSMEMEENENNYEFKYTGKDGNIYRTVGNPYNMSYTGIGDNDIELDLIYVIEKENMFLKDSQVNTAGIVDEENKISINVYSKFSNFNQLDKIEKPQGL